MKGFFGLALAAAVIGIAPMAWAAVAGDQRTITSVTVGASSAQAIAGASGRRMFLSIDNESTSATIACSFGGTAVINAAGSYTITPGQTRTWTGTPDNPLSGAAINCIASAGSTPATIESWP